MDASSHVSSAVNFKADSIRLRIFIQSVNQGCKGTQKSQLGSYSGLWVTIWCKFDIVGKKIHKDKFVFICFEQTIVQVSKTNTVVLLRTKAT